MRVGEVEGDPEGDGRRTFANGWESRLWRLEDKHLREGSSVGQFGRPRPLRIRHRRRRGMVTIAIHEVQLEFNCVTMSRYYEAFPMLGSTPISL